MPVFPDPRPSDFTDPYSGVAGITFGAPSELMAGWGSMMLNNTLRTLSKQFVSNPDTDPYRRVINATYQHITGGNEADVLEALVPMPISQEQKDQGELNRPGLNIPLNVSRRTMDRLVNDYDERQYYNFVQNSPSGAFSKAAGFGGTVAGGLLDFFAGAAAGKVLGASTKVVNTFRPLAIDIMENFGAKEIMGTQAAATANKIITSGIHGGIGVGTFSATEELAKELDRGEIGQPHEWIQSLQTVGDAAWDGLWLVGGLRLGGLMAGKGFEHVKPQVKQFIGRYYHPWSKEADDIAKEDAMGQAMNGQRPNVDPILHQGALDEAVRFQRLAEENGVDARQLSEDMEQSKTVLINEINDLSENNPYPDAVTEMAENGVSLIQDDPEAIHDEGLFMDYMQAKLKVGRETAERLYEAVMEMLPRRVNGKGDRLSQGQIYNRIRKGESFEGEMPENLRKRLELEARISELEEQIKDKKTTKKERIRKQKRVDFLKTKIKPLESVTEELAAIEAELMPEGNVRKGFRNRKAYLRLEELAATSNQARNMLMRMNLSSEAVRRQMASRMFNTAMRNLLDQYDLADSVQKHIDGAHKPLSQEQVRDYGEHLKGNHPEDWRTDYDFPEDDTRGETKALDDEINEFNLEQMDEFVEKSDHKGIQEEWEAIKKKVKNNPAYSKMARALANCIAGEAAE